MAIMSPIGNSDVINLLIERGEKLTSPWQITVLHVADRLASKINEAHILIHLLRRDKAHALINTPMPNRNPNTLIHIACFGGDMGAIVALVEAGAEIITVEDFNLVLIVRVLGRRPELSLNWENKDFDLSRHLL